MSVFQSAKRNWWCNLLPILLVGFAFALSSQSARGQAATGSIQGTITDPSGAVVPNATVTITSKATSQKVVVTTTSAGAYASGPLLPGEYTVRVEAKGFKTTEGTYTVRVGTVSTASMRLEVGAAATVVQVAGTAVEVNTSQATVQDVLGRQAISQLPVNGRNYLDLASLAPGVQIQDGAAFDPTKNGYSSISFGGRFGRTARVLVDGIDISDETVGSVTQNIPQSGIQEFQLQQSTLDLSTELTSSGAVNVTTRSGTNNWHGGGYYTGRSDQLSARFAPNQLDFSRQQYGANFGGPFIKDKLFFFGDWEYTDQPLTSPVALTSPFAALSGNYTSPFKDNMFLGRLDWTIKPGMTFFGRFSYEQNSSVRGLNPGVYQPFQNRDHTPVYVGGLDFTTGRFTHSFRFGYSKFHNEIVDGVAAAGAQNLAPGIALVISPFVSTTCLAGGESYCSGTNILAPQETFQRNAQGSYNGTYIFGNHILRYGFTINSIIGGGGAAFWGLAPSVTSLNTPATQAFADGGTFTCPDNSTGRNCPLNYPVQYVRSGNGQGFFTEIPEFNLPAGGQYDTRFSFYVGDSWKARPNLTLNFGLRYVRDTGRSDADLPAIPCSSVDPSLNFSCTGDLLAQWGPGLGGRVNQPNANFAPQLGIAWDPTGSGKTVVRLGGGLYYENAIFNNILFDRPARLQTGLFNQTIRPCSGGSAQPVTFPTGVTPTVNFCGKRIGDEVNSIIAFQNAFQAATAQAGPQANGSFVGNTLAEGNNTTGQLMFAPDYRTPFSWQMNVGVQHQFGKNSVLSVDYVRNIGLHFLIAVDQNHIGDARFLDRTAALNAISATNNMFRCGTGTDATSIGCAIASPVISPSTGLPGANIVDYANNGLDTGLFVTSGFPCGPGNCAFPGINPNLGEMQMLFPIGRSVYNALLISLRSNVTSPFRGIKRTSLIISYALSRFTSQAADQDFLPLAWDMNNPLRFTGPNSLDRTSQLGVGAVMDFPWATQVSFATHWNTAPTQNLVLPQTGQAGEIFRTDWTGDGQLGSGFAGEVLPGTNLGAFDRSVKTSDLERVVANYNSLYAGSLTPAGQALVNAGLFSVNQLQDLQAVMPSLAAPVPGHIGLSPFFTFDLNLSWNLKPSKIWKSAPESLVIQPQVSFFNLFNFQNFDPAANLLSGVLQLACSTPPSCVAPGNVTGQTRGSRTNLISPGSASGVNWYGVPRQVQFGFKVTF